MQKSGKAYDNDDNDDNGNDNGAIALYPQRIVICSRASCRARQGTVELL